MCHFNNIKALQSTNDHENETNNRLILLYNAGKGKTNLSNVDIMYWHDKSNNWHQYLTNKTL